MTQTAGGMSLDRGNVEFDFKGTMENRDIQEQGGEVSTVCIFPNSVLHFRFLDEKKTPGKKGNATL